MKSVFFALALLLFAATVPLSAQKAAPNFTLSDGSGKTYELSKLKGRPVVVNFWATWCPPCRMEIPGFVKVYEKLNKKGLEVLGISLDEKGWDVVNPFVKKNKIPYPVLLGNNETARAYGNISSIPTTFFIDKKGIIRDTHVGYMSEEDFEKKVKELL